MRLIRKRQSEYFLKYLEQKPDDQEVKWLLNMAYLTVGGYPPLVPAKYLIPADLFASKEEVGRFVDVAPLLGMSTFSMAGGIIVDDLENNGQLGRGHIKRRRLRTDALFS